MKYLTSASLRGFRCYDEADVALDHVTVFAGPNNSGKSAFLQMIRRVASVNLARHAPRAANAGVGFWDGPMFHPEPSDQRATTPLEIRFEVQKAVADRATARGAFKRRFHGRTTTGWPRVQGEEVIPWPIELTARFFSKEDGLRAAGVPPPLGEERGADTVLRYLEALPIVVIPERRDFTAPLSLTKRLTRERIEEDLVTADRLLPELIQWRCVEPDRLASLEGIASGLLGERIEIHCVPADEALLVAVGSDSGLALGGRRVSQDWVADEV